MWSVDEMKYISLEIILIVSYCHNIYQLIMHLHES